MGTPQSSFDDLKSDLLSLGDLKVWSVLVTIFGDLIRGPKDFVPGPLLTAVAGRLGIKPEALRVALHRLRKEGWITVTKEGRISHYGLSTTAQSQTEAVRSQVYPKATPRPETCHLVILDPSAATEPRPEWINLNASTSLAGAPPEGDVLSAAIAISQLPPWVSTKALPTAAAQAFATLATILESPKRPDIAGPALDQLALRILILHQWRRLALGHGTLARAIMPTEWAGHRAAGQVDRWLTAMPPPKAAVIQSIEAVQALG